MLFAVAFCCLLWIQLLYCIDYSHAVLRLGVGENGNSRQANKTHSAPVFQVVCVCVHFSTKNRPRVARGCPHVVPFVPFCRVLSFAFCIWACHARKTVQSSFSLLLLGEDGRDIIISGRGRLFPPFLARKNNLIWAWTPWMTPPTLYLHLGGASCG